MEENKNIELEQDQNNEEIIKEGLALEQEILEEIDSDFADINKEEMKKNYIIIGILYFVVIILSILLVIGIKNQKDTVKDKIDSDKEVNDKVEEEKKEDSVLPEENLEQNIIPNETPKEETLEENNIPNTNNNRDELNGELNILDQI